MVYIQYWKVFNGVLSGGLDLINPHVINEGYNVQCDCGVMNIYKFPKNEKKLKKTSLVIYVLS